MRSICLDELILKEVLYGLKELFSLACTYFWTVSGKTPCTQKIGQVRKNALRSLSKSIFILPRNGIATCSSIICNNYNKSNINLKLHNYLALMKNSPKNRTQKGPARDEWYGSKTDLQQPRSLVEDYIH